MYLQFYYRVHRLQLTDAQRLTLECMFGMVRMITNHLLNQVKHMTDQDAAGWAPSFEECEALALKLINESDYDSFSRITPSILKGILVSWLSEWDDFRQKRIKRPTFKMSRDSQHAWMIGGDVVKYEGNRFNLIGFDTEDIILPESEISVPKRSLACVLKRTSGMKYYFAALHENSSISPTGQDETITKWGSVILRLQSEMKREIQTRYYKKERQIMALRKITLHRLLRQEEEKYRSTPQDAKLSPDSRGNLAVIYNQ